MKLMMGALNGNWYCAVTGKKGRHRPDWLSEFVHQVGDLDQKATASALTALNRIEEQPESIDWGPVDSDSLPTQVFMSLSNCKQSRRDPISDNGKILLRSMGRL